MDEAAPQAAGSISGGDVDKALDVLRLTADSAEELGRQLDEAGETL